jgi:hypothetical protein
MNSQRTLHLQKAMNTIDQIPIPAATKRAEAEDQGGAAVIAVEGLRKSFGNQRV